MNPVPAIEFAPVPARSGWTRVLGGALTVVVLAVSAFGVLLVVSRPSIAYRISGGVLEIQGGESFLASRRAYPLSSITGWREVRLGRGRRTAGTGMPGLCAGYFAYDNVGKVWQVTNCSRDVLLLEVAGEDRPVLLTPPDRAAFLAAVQDRRDGDFSPPPYRQPAWWVLLKVFLVAATLPVAVYVGAAFFLASRRLRYRVGGGELEVGLLLLSKRFPLAGVHARRYTPSRALKWGGTAMPGYYAGRFSVDGVSTRVYASALRQEGVLLEGEPRLFLTPADIDGFLTALRDNGARFD
ncbi:MAG TPA: PH domain-containing protein [Thermoanaerobaculaceae bacterium]|nr:PH domain-containing protein [Thermoanaerobaculaceae bacterium]HRS16069.1 PH domain-containing protein [Thermoanaerobaculaceae bacterium]